MVSVLLPTPQSKHHNPLITSRNPTKPPDSPFRVSTVICALRNILFFVSLCFSLGYIVVLMGKSKEERSKDNNGFLLFCQILSIILEVAAKSIWYSVPNNLVVDGSVPVRLFFLFALWALTETPLIYIYVAAVTIGLIFDVPVTILAYRFYKKFFAEQLEKLSEDLQDFVGQDDNINTLAKNGQLGYFTELDIHKNQITDNNEASGIVFGGFVLLEGECVYYCDAQEYVTRAKKIAVLQAREITLRIEQQVLKGEDVEEDEIINRPRLKKGDCQITIEDCGEPASLGEMEPPGGFYACDGQIREYVLLEDCRSAHREIAIMEQRLDTLRAKNRVLRDAIKREMKGERAVVEPKDEKNIDDVD